jgi:alanine-glyoxylate transaminase/serine-glyoxylate transaminase/serine-pyruvate transaminase
MGPGPSNPYPGAVTAAGSPMLGHLDPAFLDVLDATCEELRQVFRTENSLTLPLSGTGSAGMEASLANLVRPGDPVVVGVNGLFGERLCEVAGRLGAEVVRVEAPWGQPLDPEAVLRAHPAPRIICVVHAETSTGVENDVAAVAAGKGEALLVVDAVTSLGGVPVEVDRWGADVCYSCSQKCLGAPPGLAPITVSPRARAALRERPPTWYLDLNLIAGYVEAGGGRAYHHTAPVLMVQVLHGALRALLAEGLEASWARHEAAGRVLQDGLEALGLELFAAKGHRLSSLVTVKVPTDLPGGLDEAGVRRRLLEEHGVEIGAGAGKLAGQIWRIGCMGHNARLRSVETVLAALGEVLGR